MNKLIVCPQCHRHVRAPESACPFCSRNLPARSVAAGVAGAAIVATGLSVGACFNGNAVTHYGPPLFFDAGVSDVDTGADGGE
jgi:hypothetical protein